MKVEAHLGISVNRIVKALRSQPDREAKATIRTGLVSRFHETPIKDHIFTCPAEHILHYSSEDDDGNILTWRHFIERVPSNLPNVEASRYYIYHPRTGKYVQKLHLKEFANGVFYYCRHDYKHLYESQCLSRRDRTLQYHEYERKIRRLKERKKKLRLMYDGNPTRTAKMLAYYEDRHDHYEYLATLQLMAFCERLSMKSPK